MSKNYPESSLQAIELFQTLVKLPLQELLGGDVFSVEEEAQASAPIPQALDQSASSDLVVRYRTSSAVFFAASRILHITEENKKFLLSLTLRNSVKSSYEKTELNKLHTAVMLFQLGIPVVVPRYLCFARVFPEDKPTTLFDLLATETIPLINHIFNPTQLNISDMRRKMESNKSSEMLLDEKMKSLAGIRKSGDNTFLFMSKKYLDIYGLPYLYKQA